MSVVARLIAALAMASALGLVLGIEAKVEQRVVVLSSDHHHVAAASAVTAAGSAARHEFFAPERKTPVAAVSSFDGNDDFVYKQHGDTPRLEQRGRETSYSAATMLTNLPMRPRSRNSITPVTLANSVSSLPMPTLVPGLILVPRCRTMMEPPGTNCPPNAFTPSRCAFESRPFFELPKPFLCAMTNPYTMSLICTRV